MTGQGKKSEFLTSYDLIKAFAVILMIVDHIGYYFYPDENWFRVAGRLCVPVWFFLIGYARSRDVGPALWLGIIILSVSNIFAGMSLIPLNILATILIIRFILDGMMQGLARYPAGWLPLGCLLALVALPTGMAFEYGTLGLILAMFGYALRHDLPQKNGLLCFALICFVFLQQIGFGFTQVQFVALCIGTSLVMAALFFFRPCDYPVLTARLPNPVGGVIKLLGRRTLEIYVAHLVLFKIIGVLTQPERFVFGDWKLFSPSGF